MTTVPTRCMIIGLFDSNRLRATVMNTGSRCTIDQQTEQFRTAIVSA
jgi:hypothetical protein